MSLDLCMYTSLRPSQIIACNKIDIILPNRVVSLTYIYSIIAYKSHFHDTRTLNKWPAGLLGMSLLVNETRLPTASLVFRMQCKPVLFLLSLRNHGIEDNLYILQTVNTHPLPVSISSVQKVETTQRILVWCWPLRL